MHDNEIHTDLCVYVCSRNPIAIWTIEHLVIAGSSKRQVATLLPNQVFNAPQGVHILLIDASSVSEWPAAATKWSAAGYKTILLVGNSSSIGAELRALHLGVRGIVHVSQDFAQQLCAAVTRVMNGQLFADPKILEDFYYGRRRPRPRSSTPCLSFREEQVIDLILKGFSNRRIGTVLGISERTAKFHVCNILRKLQVTNRKELMDQGKCAWQHKSA
jgi:DNA-binding NarL/FixJ family response regulator